MANMIWPALYVADSHFRFWYVAVMGLFLEAGILRLAHFPQKEVNEGENSVIFFGKAQGYSPLFFGNGM
jgi:hypothetical protein